MGRSLEEDVRLSESCLWELNRRWYHTAGPDAWVDQQIPSYATTNALVAQSYARVVFRFLQECGAAGHSNVTIVEFGCATGKFGFLFLKALTGLQRRAELSLPSWRYVLTDVTEKNVSFCRGRDVLQPFVEEGQLEFATFDVESPSVFAGADEPVVLLANYVFDGVRQDAFRVASSELLEVRVSVEVEGAETELDSPELLGQLRTTHRAVPCASEYYGVPAYDAALRAYREHLADTGFLFPIAAIRCLHRWLEAVSAPALVLSGDKGYNHASELNRLTDPEMEIHGSFSVMVNYHAIGSALQPLGVEHLCPPERDAHMAYAGFLAPRDGRFPETRLAFSEAFDGFTPFDFFTIQQDLGDEEAQPSREQALALLRLSAWDTILFLHVAEAIRTDVETLDPEEAREIRYALDRVWENHYPLAEDDDVPFSIGALLHDMDDFLAARTFFHRSLHDFGPSREVLLNLGLCEYNLGDLSAALEHFESALALDPRYARALEGKKRVLAQKKKEA